VAGPAETPAGAAHEDRSAPADGTPASGNGTPASGNGTAAAGEGMSASNGGGPAPSGVVPAQSEGIGDRPSTDRKTSSPQAAASSSLGTGVEPAMAVAVGSPAVGEENTTPVPVDTPVGDSTDDRAADVREEPPAADVRDEPAAVDVRGEPSAAAPKQPEAVVSAEASVLPTAGPAPDETSADAATGPATRPDSGTADVAEDEARRSGADTPSVNTPLAMQAKSILGVAVTGEAGKARTEAWAKIVADPGHAPELLALAAVQTIGPRAKEWAQRVGAAYPAATPDGVARLAQRQFTRFGAVSSIFAAVAGSYAPLALLGTNALTHAELALHIAAAYGLDPTDEARAADLLVLTRVHPSREDAEAAIRTAKQPAYEDGGLSDAVWRLGRMGAAQSGGWTAVRVLNRFFPGTSLLAAIMTSRSSALNMASRATAFYRRSPR
jgi:hypothetical protein